MTPIKDFSGYFAGRDGSIYSSRSRWAPRSPGKLAQYVNGRGYCVVTLCRDNSKHVKLVHRLILETFVGVCSGGFQACHNNGIKTDNRIENLRWDTPRNNNADKIKHGTAQVGEQNSFHKLNEMQVRVIWRYCKMFGYGSQAEIAQIFCVYPTTVSKIMLGTTWNTVTSKLK